jgi:hypothetical protein
VLAGGESWADPAIVSPNGLPVQVNPTFLEPGLPAFTFPQGGLSDTGSVAGAVTIVGGSGSGSGSGSASLGSYSGTGSGVSGAIVATGYADLLGQSVGTGQCVALAQASSDVGYTSTWSVARKLTVLCWHVLTKNQDYLWARPALVANKTRAMELQAGKPQKKGNQRGPAYAYNVKALRDQEQQLAHQAERNYAHFVNRWRVRPERGEARERLNPARNE